MDLHKVFQMMHHQQGHANLCANATFAGMLQNILQLKHALHAGVRSTHTA